MWKKDSEKAAERYNRRETDIRKDKKCMPYSKPRRTHKKEKIGLNRIEGNK